MTYIPVSCGSRHVGVSVFDPAKTRLVPALVQILNHGSTVSLGPPPRTHTHSRPGCPRVYPLLGLGGGSRGWTKVLTSGAYGGNFTPTNRAPRPK